MSRTTIRRSHRADRTDGNRYADALVSGLDWAREREYRGWDYADGTSSRFRRALPFENRWVNLAFQETVKRAPVNLRPLFLVEARRNYMGIGLFAMANQNAQHLADAGVIDDDVAYDAEATALLDWLVANRRRQYSGYAGGHMHEVQHLDCKTRVPDGDVVSTSMGGKALVRGGEYDSAYPAVARSAESFIVDDLEYEEHDEGATIRYHERHKNDYYTPNAGAMGARLLLDLYEYFGDEPLRDRAESILDYVVAHQQPVGGWYYRIPANASHLSMDTHHNCFIAECLLRHEEVTGSDRYAHAAERVLSFARRDLFEDDGAPNFDEESSYPRDVHAAANGVLAFTYGGDREFARRIIDWTLDELYDADDGRFMFRKERWYTKRYTLMRWCQAWMLYAISEYLADGLAD